MKDDDSSAGMLVTLSIGALAGSAFLVSYFFVQHIRPADFASNGFNSTDIATLIAGFGGAAFGGFITWLMAREATHQVLKREAILRREQEEMTFFKCGVKLSLFNNRLFSIIGAYLEQMEETIEGGKAPNATLWQRLYPLSGITFDAIRFEVDELALAMKMGGHELPNKMIALSERYASLMDAIQKFNRDRENLKNLMPMNVTDRVSVTEMTYSDMVALSPHFQSLKDLSEQNCDGLALEFDLAQEVLKDLEDASDSYFKVKKARRHGDPSATIEKYRALLAKARAVEGNGFTVQVGQPAIVSAYSWIPETVIVNYDLGLTDDDPKSS